MIGSAKRALVAVWIVVGAVHAAPAIAPREGLRAYIEPDRGITETQTVRLVFEMSGAGNAGWTPPSLGGKLKNLRVLGGPSTSFSSVWTNGRVRATSQLIYDLLPEGPGPAEVGPIELTIDGTVYRTDAIRFDVAKAAGGVPPPRDPARRPSGDADSADVFLRSELGASEAWVGEAVSLSVSLYAAERVFNLEWAAQPTLTNVWVEEFEVDPDAESYSTRLDGRNYVVFPLKRQVLVPQAAGEIEIEPYAVQVQTLARRGNSRFDLFQMGRTQSSVRKSQPIRLRVRDLPEEGKPPGFSGAVGRFDLDVSLDRRETTVNQAVAVKAVLEGEGSLRGASAPMLSVGPEFRVFDPKAQSSYRNERGKLVSKRSWEWIVIPLAPGDTGLPALEFSYFDPTTKRYATTSSAAQPLVVRRGEGGGDTEQLSRSEIQLQRRDLAFIKPLTGPLGRSGVRAYEQPLFLALCALPLAWTPLLIWFGRRRTRLQSDQGLVRARRAGGRTRKRLRQAESQVGQSDGASFHEAVGRALIGYVADRFNRSPAGLTYEMADDLLASRGAGDDLRRRFRACLEKCDFARFVPASGERGRREELLHEARELLELLERVP